MLFWRDYKNIEIILIVELKDSMIVNTKLLSSIEELENKKNFC